MIDSGQIWIGADPGGQCAFGISILESNCPPKVGCVSCAEAAIEWVKNHSPGQPSGIGVDAPLWWSAGPSGDREADRWLRHTYGFSGGEVQATNSLRGAALVQGVLFVERMQVLYPEVPVTEVHPKALIKALFKKAPASERDPARSFFSRFAVACDSSDLHERDAVVAAIAAREGFTGKWPHDLSKTSAPCEQDPKTYWLAPVHYFWPEGSDALAQSSARDQ